ncbi:MAG: nuclear transport factor 2 family protein [Opitutae bacterium]|nr:nuclear transport factor 2 family protein [Opitutae bacterium]
MKPRRIFFSALVLGLFALALPAGRAQPTSMADRLKASVIRIEETRLYALTTANTPALEEMMTADCTYVHSNGLVQSKKQFFAALGTGALSYQVFRWTEPPTVRLYGGDFAILAGKAHLEVASKAAGEAKFDVLYTAVYTVVDAEWKLASYQSTVAAK